MIFFRKFFLKVSRYIIWKRINECLLIFEQLGVFGPSIAVPYLYASDGVYVIDL